MHDLSSDRLEVRKITRKTFSNILFRFVFCREKRDEVMVFILGLVLDSYVYKIFLVQMDAFLWTSAALTVLRPSYQETECFAYETIICFVKLLDIRMHIDRVHFYLRHVILPK